VEFHARSYKIGQKHFYGCHGLAPWRLTLAATKRATEGFADATALCRGGSRLLLKLNRKFTESIERESPRHQAVASLENVAAFL